MALQSASISGPSGPLELLYSLPSAPNPAKPPLLFMHGAFCSAHDYMFFLPYFAQHGFPAYAISVRGHGASHALGWLGRMVLTSFDDWANDVKAALHHIANSHPDSPPPVLGGHSLGGGLVQYMLREDLAVPGTKAAKGAKGAQKSNDIVISGLVLLAAAPLSGGVQDIAANWQRVEAPEGYKYPWSERSALRTVDQVRAVFFGEKTDTATIQTWLDECKTPAEGLRAGLGILWRVAEAGKVLSHIQGIATPAGARRKVLSLASAGDRLIPSDVMEANHAEYAAVAGDAEDEDKDEGCMKVVLDGSGHHLMMDVAWESCAGSIVRWLNGEGLQSKP